MRNWMTFGLLLLTSPLLVAQAFAHVAIFPRQAVSGTPHHFFQVRAPVEEGIPTVELKVEIPPEWKEAGGKVDRIQHKPNWQVDIQRDEDDWIQAITWHGVEAPTYAYIDFGMIITLPNLTGLQQIQAWQKNAEGNVKAFIEDRTQEGAVNPKPGLLLLKKIEAPSAAPTANTAQAEGSTSPLLYLALSALIGGVIGGAVVKLTSKNG